MHANDHITCLFSSIGTKCPPGPLREVRALLIPTVNRVLRDNCNSQLAVTRGIMHGHEAKECSLSHYRTFPYLDLPLHKNRSCPGRKDLGYGTDKIQQLCEET